MALPRTGARSASVRSVDVPRVSDRALKLARSVRTTGEQREHWVELGLIRREPAMVRRDVSWIGRALPLSSTAKMVADRGPQRGDTQIGFVRKGTSYEALTRRVKDLAEAEKDGSGEPHFFFGVVQRDSGAGGKGESATFLFQFVGPQGVNAVKLSMTHSQALTQLSEQLAADVVLSNVQSAADVAKARLFRAPRAPSARRRSGEIRQLVNGIRDLSIDFISGNEDLLHTWSAIRHDGSPETTWMVLGYHRPEDGPEDEPTSAPTLLARGGGGIDAFGSEEVLNSVDFRPGWLYWVYARVDVEDIEGTGRFRTGSMGSGDNGQGRKQSFKVGSSKFVLISLCLSANKNSMLPTMSFRLLHHRPVVARVLKYHLYVEARSASDLSEASLVNRLLAYSEGGSKIILTVFIGTGTNGTLHKLASGASRAMNTPLMLRIDPQATLDELKTRVGSAYSWKKDRVMVMQLRRKENKDVLRSLVSSQAPVRSEEALVEVIRAATGQVTAKHLTGDDRSLAELNLVSGDELYIQLTKSTQRASVRVVREMERVGLVERRRRQIEEFLAMRERQQQFRMPMYRSLRRIGSQADADATAAASAPAPRMRHVELDAEDDDDDEGEEEEQKVVERKPASRKQRKSSKNVRRKSTKAAAAAPKPSTKGSGSKKASKRRVPKDSPKEADAREAPEAPPRKSMMAMLMQQQLAAGRQKLRKSAAVPASADPGPAETDDLKYNRSAQLLHVLAEKATNLGARIVDAEDIIILDKRVLGDGRTARVREGLLLCKLEQLPELAKSRKSQVVSTRASWMRMRKSSVGPLSAKALYSGSGGGAEAADRPEDGEFSPAQAPGRRGRHRSSVVSALPGEAQDGIFDFVALKVAVKMFTARFVTKSVFEVFLEEIQVLVALHHSSIVQILGVYIDDSAQPGSDPAQASLMIMYELMPRGSLSQLRETELWLDLPFTMKIKMALDVARGIQYLHSQDPPVLHRDLKSDNMLVDEDFALKIGDFGISTRVEGSAIRSKVGTSGWVAPEVLKDTEAGYGLSSDIFSFGIILWELITNERNPLAGLVENNYVEALERGDRPQLPSPVGSVEESYSALVRDCWELCPEDRPSADQVVSRLVAMLDSLLKSR